MDILHAHSLFCSDLTDRAKLEGFFIYMIIKLLAGI